ncbi:MAG: phosphate acyltransferase PlsX [gamma proteobacterium symbiont of Lucinoma myriamae]|nr:phosphate acyltransferase PlsX [gamma proteobacterium symbiont of Lucinoma myriamae]MCU7818121.1 phosphate acyltransferase PlsX [gamma proteobacterium symbiont of Lucinoma myriamae]MCU7831199.1 phosphate acyltransferase PlsX [gamma proteobacterium symbiont of Lucinoma myriamae]
MINDLHNSTLAIDAMGGDIGLDVTVPAVIDTLKDYAHLKIVLVGDQRAVEQRLESCPASIRQQIVIQHASQVVGMDEKPASALRGKKDSSMRVAINLVKSGDADACVSAGNTGALMATGRFVLKTLPGIDRPAICSAIPTQTGHTHMLDLGANIDLSAQHLFEFAVMGSVLTSAIDNIEKPTIGLLNIGEEEMKGNEQVQQAAQLISNSNLNYHGFIEGDDIYKGVVDVVVADGFVGNISLKTSEGVAKMIIFYIKREFNINWLTKLAGLVAMPVLNAFKRKIDPRKYNGASLVGLKGIVVKSHGGADVFSFSNAIKVAMLEVENKVPQKISKVLEETLVDNNEPDLN